MKNVLFLLFLSLPALAHSQVISEEQLQSMVKTEQEKCDGAHQSIVMRANEEFAKSIWGKKVRFNQAKIVKFIKRPSGEKVSGVVDLSMNNKSTVGYSYDSKTASDLLTANGVRVTPSYNTLWISANQDLLYAESETDGHKTVLELYCSQQRFFEVLRIGKIQSIEFLITGYSGSVSANTKIYGVLTEVYAEKQVVKCSNGHEFDKDAGYKFCPTCGEALK